jgi:hypothetical protein
MSEIDLYDDGGEIAPYNPGAPLLAPAPDFGTNDVDLLRKTDSRGNPLLPPGVTITQATEHYKALGDIFAQDFVKLGHNISQTQKAVSWFMNALTNPPAKQQKRHSYNLFEHTNDPLFQAFANYAHDHGFPAKFVQDACWWVTEAAKKLNTPAGSGVQPGMAPSTSTEAILNSLSDADYAKVIKINEQALAKTMQILQHRWGDYTFRQNIQIAQDYLSRLPANEQKHFDQFTTGWVHMHNTVEFITAMFDAATGAHNLPRNGVDIAREIEECERCMKTNRKQWLADSALQARYRTLLQMRG